jgi:sigma-B regulation protein RsbU (phosphoserine phosphatase)
MVEWLRSTTWFQRLALLVLSWAVLQQIHGWVTGEGALSPLPFGAGLLCFSAFRSQILWRMRNQLLVTFFLLGVLPLVLIGLMLVVAAQVGLGQLATILVKQELKYRPSVPSVGDTFADGGIVVGAAIPEGINIDLHLDGSGMSIFTGRKPNRQTVQSPKVPAPKAWWDVTVASLLPLPRTSEHAPVVLGLLSRPSALLSEPPSGPLVFYALAMIGIAGAMLALVWISALIAAIRLTRAITGSVHDLHEGTLHVAKGDFTHQIPVRGNDQLSELGRSFNSMTARIQHLIGEVKKKEKLEAELEIARQVQVKLFPDAVPDMATLEMIGVCIPGRVVSGDYYDFIKVDEHSVAIAIGDVSGKGVSAALLMAGIQSALHSQLKYGHLDANTLSTAALMEQMSQQLYDNTPPEKYATFFCALYDDRTGLLRYTNAGHLKPILVRDGQATGLEGDGMVAGLLPNVKYDEHEIVLRHGDLVALFSDGVPEAEDAQQKEFGEEHLSELLREHAADPLGKILTMVTGAVDEWIHDPGGRDDTTVVLLRKR